MLGFISDSPQILASLHQLDLAPYASGSCSAQWNVPEVLHDMHMLRSSRILRNMEVEETWHRLWLPLQYQVDKGAS